MKNNLAHIETKRDYLFASAAPALLFITIKGVIPIFIYVFLILIVAFYFFPFRLIGKTIKNMSYFDKVILIITGVVFSTILSFSILNLYIPDSSFFSNTILALSFVNFLIMVYYYLKFNKFLLVNFIFCFVISMLIF
ncbi:hypothetical protein [Tenacibaculum ascidiaceicola]|uniref:hypothetical protein n=1 Tax=Tenacibaculum ascidiaceicola TaxID=1699411 RepID=UPI003CE4A6BD